MRIEAARSIPFASRTLPGILKLQAERCRDKLLIMSQDHSITYAEAPAIAARSAGRLATAGVGAGDRVVAFLSNSVDLIELWFGAAWLGAVLAPINTAFRDEQLRHALAVAGPVLLVTERELLEHLYNPARRHGAYTAQGSAGTGRSRSSYPHRPVTGHCAGTGGAVPRPVRQQRKAQK